MNETSSSLTPSHHHHYQSYSDYNELSKNSYLNLRNSQNDILEQQQQDDEVLIPNLDTNNENFSLGNIEDDDSKINDTDFDNLSEFMYQSDSLLISNINNNNNINNNIYRPHTHYNLLYNPSSNDTISSPASKLNDLKLNETTTTTPTFMKTSSKRKLNDVMLIEQANEEEQEEKETAISLKQLKQSTPNDYFTITLKKKKLNNNFSLIIDACSENVHDFLRFTQVI